MNEVLTQFRDSSCTFCGRNGHRASQCPSRSVLPPSPLPVRRLFADDQLDMGDKWDMRSIPQASRS